MIEGVDYFPIVDAEKIDEIGKDFHLVLSLLMLTKWPRIIYQNTSYRFDEYNRTIVLDDDDMVMTLFSILLQNDWRKIY